MKLKILLLFSDFDFMRTEICTCVISLLTQDSVLINSWNTCINLVFKKAKLSGMSWLLRGLSSKFTWRY